MNSIYTRKIKPLQILILCLMAFSFNLTACKNQSQKITTIWTDQSEFVSYVELFNKSQSTHKIVVEYKKNPAQALLTSKTAPDLVIGPWLKGEKTRSKLIPLDYLFNELKINTRLFYPQLLDLGHIKGRQYLLPISFNLPALIFSPEHNDLITQDFSLSLDQIQAISEIFNTKKGNTYTRMGFSPRWQTDFLYLTAKLFDARFEEGGSLFTYNKNNVDQAINFIRTWTNVTNTSKTAEDEFEFKYLYDPPYKLVTSNRNL
ncbi:MAG TPA: carbohydrate ABC transporter substrate-binding protein, partial [Treponemataceae bacterium]|nr:carbohydrate ABC transporter substrate-binding protein [Treponemataceae bacterium]